MNRSLRHLAVLGLFALGASSAGAQVLFNVTYNPSSYQLTLTPTNANPGGNLPASGGTTFSMGYELVFDNFFTAYPSSLLGTPPDLNVTVGLGGGIGGGFRAQTQSDNTALFNIARDDFTGGRDLSIGNSVAGANFTLDRSTQAFSTSSSLVLTFPSSLSSNLATLMPGSSFSGGTISAYNGTDYTIGSYSYSVVPEPSTYAAIAGALGLGYAVYRRRRQAAAAAAAA